MGGGVRRAKHHLIDLDPAGQASLHDAAPLSPRLVALWHIIQPLLLDTSRRAVAALSVKSILRMPRSISMGSSTGLTFITYVGSGCCPNKKRTCLFSLVPVQRFSED